METEASGIIFAKIKQAQFETKLGCSTHFTHPALRYSFSDASKYIPANPLFKHQYFPRRHIAEFIVYTNQRIYGKCLLCILSCSCCSVFDSNGWKLKESINVQKTPYPPKILKIWLKIWGKKKCKYFSVPILWINIS